MSNPTQGPDTTYSETSTIWSDKAGVSQVNIDRNLSETERATFLAHGLYVTTTRTCKTVETYR